MELLSNFGTFIVICLLCNYITLFSRLIFTSENEKIVVKNTKLEELRKIPIKTVEQQKEFLQIKSPIIKTKFNWIGFIIMSLFNLTLFYMIWRVFDHYSVKVNIYIGLMSMILVPLIANLILKKYNLQGNNTLLDVLR